MNTRPDVSSSPRGTEVLQARVVVVLPEFSQVRVEAVDGLQFTINRATPGVDYRTLHQGDVVEPLLSFAQSYINAAPLLSWLC